MKLKILYTIPNFDTAGSGKVLYDLAKGLDKNKFEVAIACKNTKGIFFEEIQKLGLPIHIIEIDKPLKPYYSLLFRISPFRQFIKNQKFDIVHSWHWSSDWTEALATRLAGAKYMYSKKAMTWNKHWVIKSKLSNFIITINDEMRNYFPNKKHQKLIPLGLDLEYYKPQSARQEDGFFKIITVANLVPVKGVEVLIRAVKAINNPIVKLEILGDDRSDYAAYLKELVANENLSNQISFLGKHNDIRPFVANADLYIIPTLDEGRKEGMPMALVEAMSMEKPVLGSNISGIKYVLKDFSELLFEANNSEQLVKKIEKMIVMSSNEREMIGKELREYCIENFSYESFIMAHQNLYSDLVKKA